MTATSKDLESPAAIAAVDDILGNIGLTHGTRSTRKNTWHQGARRPTGNKKSAGEKAATVPKEKPAPLHAPALQAAKNLVHGFSTRAGGVSRCYRPWLPAGLGDLNLGFTAHDDPANVQANRARLLKALKATRFQRFALLSQRHTPIIRILHSLDDATADFAQPGQMRGDAVITNVPGILLTIQTADCIPVLLFDPKQRAIAAFHAGWRGTLARIVERGIGTMQREYGSRPRDILAAIGPGIGPASYSVGEDLQHDFRSQFAYADDLFTDVYDSDPIREKYPLLFLTARAPGHSPIGPQLHLDLPAANRRQLLAAGLKPAHITTLAEDTAADTGRYFSHRAEAGFTGRMMSVIGLTR